MEDISGVGIGGFIHLKVMLAGIGRKSTESSNFSAVIQKKNIRLMRAIDGC